MHIASIELTNTKSYSTAKIELAQGVNAICGENGAGKTTLLEAIGYALFDVPPYRPIEHFVQEGEKTGTVVVSLISSQDEREYQVIRKFGAATDYYIYDPELEAKLVEGKADVLAWLTEQFVVDSVDALHVLFTDAVGVPQGQLTAAFHLKQAERKLLFDRLLEVEDYDKAARELLETSRFVKDEITQRRIQAADWDGQVRALAGQEKAIEEREAVIVEDQTQLDELNNEFKAISKELGDLEKQKQVLEALKAKASTLAERVEGLAAQQKNVGREVEAARQAKVLAGKAKPGFDTFTAAAEKLEALDDLRQERDKLNTKLNALDGTRKSLVASLQGLDDQLRNIQLSEKQMSELRPRVDQQDDLELKLAAAESRVEQRRQVRDRLAEEKTALEELESDLADAEKALAQRQQVESKAAEAQAKLASLDAEVSRLEGQYAVLEAEQERLESLKPILADAVGAACPVCQQPLSESHRKSVLKETRERVGAIKGEAAQISQQQKTFAAHRKSIQGTIGQCEAKLDELARPSDQRALERKVAKKRNDTFEWQAKLDALADATGTAKALKEGLKGLGNPHKLYHQLEGQASSRSKVEQDHVKTTDRLAKNVSEVRALEKALLAYSDLDQQILGARRAQAAAKADHNAYLKNADIAEKLPAYEKQLTAIVKNLTNAQTEAGRVQEALGEGLAAYDARRHKRASERNEQLVAQRQGLVERIKLHRAEIKKVDAEVKRLHRVEKDLRTLHAEIDELEEVRTLVEYIRTLLKTAGPYITRLLVQAVSQRAAQLYGDVMSDTLGRLTWSDGYELTLEVAGRTRQFAQLSGGEQMAAALAVRLALLRELSAIDIAFLDEPTSNLDESRRDNLAEQMVKVSGFSQLIVISHDDTFERLTDHVIRLTKVNGQSQVYAE